MSWPLASEFTMIVQNPQIAFKDPDLKRCAIVRDHNGQPKPLAGSFAVVYKGEMPDGSAMAVRAFTSESAERRQRYEAISNYLSKRSLKSLVKFQYRDKGIRSPKGQWYPLVTMEWVPGDILFEWLRRQCASGNRGVLEASWKRWIEVIKELESHGIAHGDLQHANVMVTDKNELKLVDYDCMCVPALVGQRNLEIGVEPYQHPERNERTLLTPRLDNFSALFILVALRALAVDPGLWNTYIESTGYDKLLFKAEDLLEPSQSRLIQALKRSADSELGELTKALVDLVRVPMDQVPGLDSVLNSYSKVETLLGQKAWDDAYELISRRPSTKDAPRHLQRLMQEARERVECRQELEKAVAQGDEDAMVRLYKPKLLDDYPKARPAVEVARKAPLVLPVLQQLRQLRQQQAWRKFVAQVDQEQRLLNGRKSAAPFIAEAQAWRPRNQLCAELEQLLQTPDPDGSAVKDRWSRMLGSGQIHPEIAPQKSRIEKLLERHDAWSVFLAVGATVSRKKDEELQKAWNEKQFAGWPRAERERPRVEAARQRLAVLREAVQLARQTPRTLAGERALVDLPSSLPSGYDHGLEPRLEQARQGLALLEELKTRMAEPISDLALIDVLYRLQKQEAISLISPEYGPRINLAKSRFPLLQQLQQISLSLPPHQLDVQLLAVWKDDLLRDCYDARAWNANYRTAVQRQGVLKQLETAIAVMDEKTIWELHTHPLLQNFQLKADWLKILKEVKQRLGAASELLDALKRGDRAAILKHLDASMIRRYPQMFKPHQEQLRAIAESALRQPATLGLALPKVTQAVLAQRGSEPMYKIRWTWPAAQYTTECVLALCGERPKPTEDPNAYRAILRRWDLERSRWESGGSVHRVTLKPEWHGCYVVVWAKLDLGFWSGHSEPLILGRLD